MGTLDIAIQWRAKRAERLALAKQVEALEEVEKALKQQVMDNLRKAKNKAISNGERLFQLVTKDEPTIDDWPALYKHIQKTGEFELLERRVNRGSVKERWQIGKKVPGIGSIPVESLSDTKASS